MKTFQSVEDCLLSDKNRLIDSLIVTSTHLSCQTVMTNCHDKLSFQTVMFALGDGGYHYELKCVHLQTVQKHWKS
jgi:hypothetical protein